MGDDHDLPSIGLVSSIGSPALTDALASAADLGLDLAIESGALDQVPIFGMLVSFYRAKRSISEKTLLKKARQFLVGISSLTKQERHAFSDGLIASGEVDNFSERVFLLLEQADDFSKPELMGRIVANFIRGGYDVDVCFMLCSAVNRSYSKDLYRLRDFRTGVQREPEAAERLFAAGLLTNGGFDGGGADQEKQPGGTIYHLSNLGELLAPLV